MSDSFSGRFRITNNEQIRKHAENTDDPRHVFYRAMISSRTYEEYLESVGSVTVQPETTAYAVTGHKEIRYCRNKLRWIEDDGAVRPCLSAQARPRGPSCEARTVQEKGSLVSVDDLSRYKMQRIADVEIIDGRFTISLSDPSAGDLQRCIYAYLVGGEILRIGSSKGKLSYRLRDWQSGVSNALAGDYSRTPQHEAEIWRSMLSDHGKGYLYARSGTLVTTPVGEFNLYLYEERELIARHRPRCCNDVKLRRTP